MLQTMKLEGALLPGDRYFEVQADPPGLILGDVVCLRIGRDTVHACLIAPRTFEIATVIEREERVQ